MPVYRVDAIMPYITHIPRDVTVNTFHVEAASMTGDQLNAVHGAIPGFYNNVPGAASVASRMASYIDRASNACTLTIREVGVPGAPLDEFTWTLGAAAYNPCLPFEVSLCLSYASLVPGVNRGRTRGRIYIGPLGDGAGTISSPAGEQPVPPNSFMEDLADAAAELHGALASYDVEWGVYSRVAETLYPIEGGWVDNAFDTQRRRQIDATARQEWVVP